MTVVCHKYWNKIDCKGESVWTDVSVSILPSLMGFSIGGMAIFLSFSNSKFLNLIQKKGDPASLYMKICATFLHFILIQTLAIMFILFDKAAHYACGGLLRTAISGVGFFLFVYGVLGALAIGGLLLQMARIFNAQAGLDD